MKEKIEQMYIDALNNDDAPNVFAEQLLNLFNTEPLHLNTNQVFIYEGTKMHFTKSKEGANMLKLAHYNIEPSFKVQQLDRVLHQCPYSKATKCNLEDPCLGCESWAEYMQKDIKTDK